MEGFTLLELLKFFKMEKTAFSWKMKTFLFFIFTFPFVILFWIVAGKEVINPRTPEEVFLNIREKISCQGVVDSIYRQKMNHNVQTLKTRYCIFQLDAVWEDRFLIGDSISKKKGELFLEHYRDGKLLEILDYHDIAKNRK